MFTELTDRQSEVLDFIRRYAAEKQRPPSVREIGEELGITSPNGVLCHLRALEKKGYLAVDHRIARGIRIMSRPSTVRPGRDRFAFFRRYRPQPCLAASFATS